MAKDNNNNNNNHTPRETPILTARNWKQERFRTRWTRVEYLFCVVGVCMVVCMVFIAVRTFAPTPTGSLSQDCPCSDGLLYCLCPRPTVEALTVLELVCLANSRLAAYMVYPPLLLLFLTMCRNLLSVLQTTILAEYIPLTSLHHLHVWCGTVVGGAVMWHGVWHLIRWGLQNNWRFVIDTPSGRTGLICFIVTPFLVWPMRLAALRQSISFELRKRTHYLSWVWMGSLLFHAPQQNVFWIAGSAFVIYLVDWFYGVLVNTRLAPSARFVRLQAAVMIRVRRPANFQLKGSGGFCYLCIPWVSKVEWHAFSVFKDPFDSEFVCFCIAINGDWTRKLHEAVHEPIYRRLWMYGPFPSPFESATDNDNVISIASGIGITPALSVIKTLADHRKMHLIWMVRDASLLEFMIDYGIALDEDAYTLIFYTGKRELVFRRVLPYNVLIYKGRPDLDDLIVSLIQATKNRQELDMTRYTALHHDYVDDMEASSTVRHHFYAEITRLALTYSVEELFNAAVRKSNLNSRRVCFEGLRELVNSIFIRNFSDDQLRSLFEMADADQTGGINFEEFQAFVEELEAEASKFLEDLKATRSESDDVTRSVIAPLSEETKQIQVAQPEHWRLMYCGGSKPVVKALKGVSTEHRIPLSIESFDW